MTMCTAANERAASLAGCRRMFFVSRVYIIYESATDLWSKRAPSTAFPGILLACFPRRDATPFACETKSGHALGSAAMHADAKQPEFLYLSLGHTPRRSSSERGFRPVVGRSRGRHHHGSIIAKEGIDGLQGKPATIAARRSLRDELGLPPREESQSWNGFPGQSNRALFQRGDFLNGKGLALQSSLTVTFWPASFESSDSCASKCRVSFRSSAYFIASFTHI